MAHLISWWIPEARLRLSIHRSPQNSTSSLKAGSALFRSQAMRRRSVTVLDTLEAVSHVIEKSPAIVQDLGQIQAADPRIRGVLGESFLAHFDLLIDYGRRLFCLDETNTMRDRVRGERVPLPRSMPTERICMSMILLEPAKRSLTSLWRSSGGPSH